MDADERDAVATEFGVASAQVERDHLVSHLLGHLTERFGDSIHFIGGTALARTYLPHGRLSEDIDLVAIDRRKNVALALDDALPRAVARTHGRLRVEPRLSEVADTVPVTLRSDDGIVVRLQLLSSRDRTIWPVERRDLEQRYRDAPPARLLVPTLPAFAASKTATWADRTAPRDLWDLWALNGIGAIDATACELFVRLGPTNQPPAAHVFRRAPAADAWHSQLAGQTRLTVTAVEALTVVRHAWANVTTQL